ncbi:MAG: hypothetical protein WDO73_14600 [Ignavibacteriota bacterium]
MAMDVKGQSLTLLYTGELSGDELHLTLSVRGMPGEERITMRRVDPKGSLLARYAENPALKRSPAWLKANAIRLASVPGDRRLRRYGAAEGPPPGRPHRRDGRGDPRAPASFSSSNSACSVFSWSSLASPFSALKRTGPSRLR